jgi:YfiH family protein
MSWQQAMHERRGVHPEWLVPDWDAPPRVRAFVTTRAGGVSRGAYATMNLSASNGDEPMDVARNRAIVCEALPAMPAWMRQVHGTDVLDLDRWSGDRPTADAAVASRQGKVCNVLTADCLPVLLCDAEGSRVAIAHAGWRGLAAGVIENCVGALQAPPGEVLAWLGPAIGPRAFEVGPEVREAFVSRDPRAESAFAPHVPGKFMADLYALARQRLEGMGVARIHGGGFCTYTETERFFSYRREKMSGRLGAFIWLA